MKIQTFAAGLLLLQLAKAHAQIVSPEEFKSRSALAFNTAATAKPRSDVAAGEASAMPSPGKTGPAAIRIILTPREQTRINQLIAQLRNPKWDNRAEAIAELGDMREKSVQAIQPLLALLKTEKSRGIFMAAEQALIKIGPPRTKEGQVDQKAILKLLGDDPITTRYWAATYATSVGPDANKDLILALFQTLHETAFLQNFYKSEERVEGQRVGWGGHLVYFTVKVPESRILAIREKAAHALENIGPLAAFYLKIKREDMEPDPYAQKIKNALQNDTPFDLSFPSPRKSRIVGDEYYSNRKQLYHMKRILLKEFDKVKRRLDQVLENIASKN